MKIYETMICENIKSVLSNIPQNVTLVAVSKTHSTGSIIYAYNTGIKDFGESRVQELTSKQPHLPSDIRWHLIGHLQRNKVKFIAPFIHLIHSIDSESLLNEIQKEALKNNRIISVLLEVHIAKEEAKFGFSPDEVYHFFKLFKNKEYNNVCFKGLMGMATYTSDVNLIKNEFQTINDLFQQIKTDFGKSLPNFNELSIGMSSDYKLAIECGSTMVRIGSLIFDEKHEK
jgi:hypothetical protein